MSKNNVIEFEGRAAEFEGRAARVDPLSELLQTGAEKLILLLGCSLMLFWKQIVGNQKEKWRLLFNCRVLP